MNDKIRYFLGIDAGGTKTEFLLTDENGNEIKRVFLGSANPLNSGAEKAQEILSTGISQVCEGIKLSEVSVFAGLAGGISGNNKVIISNFLSSFGFGAYGNGSDTDNALEAALNGEDGVVVIMGTGIVAFCQKNSERFRVGGWGYMIDKGGSGFSVGSDVLDAAFKDFDGRSNSGVIRQLVEKKINRPLPEIIGDIYSEGAVSVAAFAPVAFEAYDMGDKDAEKILSRNAQEIAVLIRTCCEKIGKSDRIVLCGGMCKRKDILAPMIENHLGGGYNSGFLNEPMVNGAVSLAMKIGGKSC